MENENNRSNSFANKAKDYHQLTKFTLSFTVVFSCVVCFLLAPNIIGFDWRMIAILFLAGMLVTGSANAINQAVEKDTDAVMKRTGSRPVAAGRMSQQEAYTFAVIAGIVGVGIMWYFFNLSSALLSAFSLFLYAFIYTPLKKINSIAVLVGALPGALPCLIGWVAATDEFSPSVSFLVGDRLYSNAGGWALFLIQFLWQFPHFWAIAWVAYEDYSKAGFRLLPSRGGPTKYAAVQAILYSVLLIPIGVLPFVFGMTGMVSVVIVALANLAMLWQSIQLFNKMDVASARKVMFGSYIYLPVVLLALLADKMN
jgi:protoheme IX farnesyltransferase